MDALQLHDLRIFGEVRNGKVASSAMGENRREVVNVSREKGTVFKKGS